MTGISLEKSLDLGLFFQLNVTVFYFNFSFVEEASAFSCAAVYKSG